MTPRILAYREMQWALSEPLLNENWPIHVKGKTILEYRFECSRGNCVARNDLRLCPSGIFCFDHYHSMEPCIEPECFEPAVEKSRCRDHWLGHIEFPRFDVVAAWHMQKYTDVRYDLYCRYPPWDVQDVSVAGE